MCIACCQGVLTAAAVALTLQYEHGLNEADEVHRGNKAEKRSTVS